MFGEGAGGEGEGEGGDGGRTGEQGFKGSPHKSEFPTKEEFGNFWRDNGIEPLRLLWLILICFSLGRVILGMGPESKLFWRLKPVS